jgi:hypothetical protein
VKYIIALLIGSVLGSLSYFMVDFAYQTITLFKANPTDVGLFIGAMMTSCTAFVCVGATACLTIIELTSE